MFNITSKYLRILNNTPTENWVEHIAMDFLTCYSWSYYSSHNGKTYQLYPLHKNQRFPLRIFFSKCDQIYRRLRIWSTFLEKSLMKNLFFVQLPYLKKIQQLYKSREVHLAFCWYYHLFLLEVRITCD